MHATAASGLKLLAQHGSYMRQSEVMVWEWTERRRQGYAVLEGCRYHGKKCPCSTWQHSARSFPPHCCMAGCALNTFSCFACLICIILAYLCPNIRLCLLLLIIVTQFYCRKKVYITPWLTAAGSCLGHHDMLCSVTCWPHYSKLID